MKNKEDEKFLEEIQSKTYIRNGATTTVFITQDNVERLDELCVKYFKDKIAKKDIINALLQKGYESYKKGI